MLGAKAAWLIPLLDSTVKSQTPQTPRRQMTPRPNSLDTAQAKATRPAAAADGPRGARKLERYPRNNWTGESPVPPVGQRKATRPAAAADRPRGARKLERYPRNNWTGETACPTSWPDVRTPGGTGRLACLRR